MPGGGYVLHCRTVQLLMPKSIVLLGISRLWGCQEKTYIDCAHLGQLLVPHPQFYLESQRFGAVKKTLMKLLHRICTFGQAVRGEPMLRTRKQTQLTEGIVGS